MAISAGGSTETPMSDINTTPLVDVMLVMIIIFLIAVPVAIQTVEDLEIPVISSTESKDKVENLLVTVTSTDEAGLSPTMRDTAYSGSSRNGECRVFLNNTTLVNNQELYDLAFRKLDAIVQRAGGPEAIMANPDQIPQVQIRADVNVPWRCVAGVIYNVQLASYPIVGFISNRQDPNG